ncbi:LPXTG cell wall anchor domain-containing protein [Anaerobaca lacustris]|uniref:LPXTG cell wall anchor domain-containing protein n=1 Tax=Anaerobaca lacustris TaxID=3044600 RepID=A0AAW6TQG5_9BACT|nr:LPXTG cell wall anchor domain-containing protein [Sedimentisphaerales bacterium M17dextr]
MLGLLGAMSSSGGGAQGANAPQSLGGDTQSVSAGNVTFGGGLPKTGFSMDSNTSMVVAVAAVAVVLVLALGGRRK